MPTYINLTILSLEANFTLTLVTIQLINTVAFIMTGVVLTVVNVDVADLPLVARDTVTVEVILPVPAGPVNTGAGLALVRLLFTVRTNIARPAVTLKALTVLQASSIVEARTGLASPQQTGGRGDVEVTALSHHPAVLRLGYRTLQGEGLVLLSLLALLRSRANLSPEEGNYQPLALGQKI